MRWVRLVVLAGGGLLVAGSGYAQGVPRSGKAALRLMVANPFSPAAADSGSAVQIGSGIRDEVTDFAGADYQVITQAQMNEALSQFSYPTDAVLSPPSAFELARSMNARVVVVGTLGKGDNGQYLITARIVGLSDTVGNVATVFKQPVELLSDFGRRVGDTVQQSLKALRDAKECVEESQDRPDKALKAAQKALKRVPNHGLAHFCLFRLAEKQNAPVEEQLAQLEALTKGDPHSIIGWRLLANTYLAVKDTIKTLWAAQQLLKIAPQDQELRRNVVQYFISLDKPQLALEVVNDGLKIEPLNPALFELKASACLSLKDYTCSAGALRSLYAADSTKADTAFFNKMMAVVVQVDTTEFVRWAQAAVRKFPDDLQLLDNLRRGYLWTKQLDSTVVVVKQIMQRDTTSAPKALTVVRLLAQAKRFPEATPFMEFIQQYGEPQQKNHLAGILLPVSRDRLLGDSAAGVAPDLAGAIDLAQLAVQLADSSTKTYHTANYILGVALFSQVTQIDSLTESQESCDSARKEQQLLAEAKGYLIHAQDAQGTNQTQVQQYLNFIDKFDPRVTAMLKKYCR